MPITVRQRDTDEPLTDLLMFDHLGREIAFADDVFGSSQSNDALRAMIAMSPAEEGTPVRTSTGQLPATLPFTLG